MPLDLDRIKALCFDVDGTLNDTDDQYTQAVKRLLKPLDVFPFFDRDRIARRFVMWAEAPGNALLGYADRIGIDDRATALVEWMNRHRRHRPKDFRLMDGVAEMLNELDGRYPMSVVSARDEQTTRMFLEEFDLAGHFTCIVTGQTCRHTKPFPDPLFWAANHMGVPPENCLMIGDTTVDIRAGRSAGAQTVGVLCGFGEEGELRRMGADEILMSTAELGRALRERR
jgi:phosphoglycolate phosphatase-like HAD superfamily hydrolase